MIYPHAVDRVQHADRRGAGAGQHRAAARHTHRDHGSGARSRRADGQGARSRGDRHDRQRRRGRRRLRRPWRRRWRRRQPRQHSAAAHAERRADPFERADRHGPAAPAGRNPRRDRPRQCVGRQPADEPFPLRRRQQRRWPARARDPRRGPGRSTARGAGDQGPARHGARHRRRAARPRRWPSRARGPRRPCQGGAARHQRDHRRQHDPHERLGHAGRDVPAVRQGVPDHRPAA